jgi:hypothetical protein
MKTLLKTIAVLLLILIGTVVYVVMFRVGPKVERAIETILPKALGTEVTIDSMSILPLQGSIQLHGLSIANPKGFSGPYIAVAKELKFVISLRSLLTETLVLKEIEIKAPTFNYERTLKTDNMKSIHHNVTVYLAERKAAKTEAEREATSKKPARKVIIERFVMTGGQVNAKFTALPTAPIPLSTIQLNDIGKKPAGTSWGHVGRTIGSSITDAVLAAVSNVQDITRIALQSTGHAVMGTATGAGGAVIGSAAETGSAVLHTATDTTEVLKHSVTDAAKSLGNLFRKKE